MSVVSVIFRSLPLDTLVAAAQAAAFTLTGIGIGLALMWADFSAMKHRADRLAGELADTRQALEQAQARLTRLLKGRGHA